MSYHAGTVAASRSNPIKVIAWDFDDTIKHTLPGSLFGRVPEKAFCVDQHEQYQQYEQICMHGHINFDDVTPNVAWYKLTFALLQKFQIDSVLATQRLYQVTEREPTLYQRNMEGCYAYLDMLFGKARPFLFRIPDRDRQGMYVGSNYDSTSLKKSYLEFYQRQYSCAPEQVVLVDDNIDYAAPVTAAKFNFIQANWQGDHLAIVLRKCIGFPRVYTELRNLALPSGVTTEDRSDFVKFLETFDVEKSWQNLVSSQSVKLLIKNIQDAPSRRFRRGTNEKATALKGLLAQVESHEFPYMTIVEAQGYVKKLAEIACKVRGKFASKKQTNTAKCLLNELNSGQAIWGNVIPGLPFTHKELVDFTGYSKEQLASADHKAALYKID